MAGQATGCNGHEHRRWCRQRCRHRRPSLAPLPTDSWRRVQGRAISPQYKDRMTAGTAGGGSGWDGVTACMRVQCGAVQACQ